MEKDVLITIKSSQSLEGQIAEPAELISLGKYSWSEELQSFSYMESELTGLEGTRTRFEVRPDEVVMTRTGSVTSRMVYCKGKKHHFMHNTPYGTLSLGMNTHLIESGLNEAGGSLRIEYDLDFENALLSHNKFSITIKENS